MDPVVETFMDGMGAAAATAGFLNQLQGRIFGLLYLQPEPISLDEIGRALGQSKSNVSVNVRDLVDWRLAQRVRVEGSRKDHYVAATDFWQVVIEIMERRFRWNVRQVLAASAETERVAEALGAKRKDAAITPELLQQRLEAIGSFFRVLDGLLSSLPREAPPPAGYLLPASSQADGRRGSRSKSR